MVIEVMFWILLVLCFLACFAPNDPKWAWSAKGQLVVLLLLLAILGFWHQNPLTK